jgi:beta-lactamase class A
VDPGEGVAPSTAAPVPAATEQVVVGMAVARAFEPMAAQLSGVESASGARIAVSLIELGGANPQSWSFHGDDQFIAASTYKLPLLMAEAQSIVAGQVEPGDQLCYTSEDWEDGWFQDYGPGACYSREDLASRIGQDSDNTAAHMLVRYLGGGSALNAYAAGHGASESAFYEPNTTTASDLARLMASEATGTAGGAAAQQWLYPLLTHTAFEQGIPAGVPATATVVHKTGELDWVTNDVALVQGGANGPYVVAICVEGPGGDAGFSVIAQVARLVWQMEASR